MASAIARTDGSGKIAWWRRRTSGIKRVRNCSESRRNSRRNAKKSHGCMQKRRRRASAQRKRAQRARRSDDDRAKRQKRKRRRQRSSWRACGTTTRRCRRAWWRAAKSWRRCPSGLSSAESAEQRLDGRNGAVGDERVYFASNSSTQRWQQRKDGAGNRMRDSSALQVEELRKEKTRLKN